MRVLCTVHVKESADHNDRRLILVIADSHHRVTEEACQHDKDSQLEVNPAAGPVTSAVDGEPVERRGERGAVSGCGPQSCECKMTDDYAVVQSTSPHKHQSSFTGRGHGTWAPARQAAQLCQPSQSHPIQFPCTSNCIRSRSHVAYIQLFIHSF